METNYPFQEESEIPSKKAYKKGLPIWKPFFVNSI
jgi:hypothetical protein